MKNIVISLLFLIPLSAHSKDLGYNPKADPDQQITAASSLAKEEGKLILLIAGGDWCRWCYVLDKYIANNGKINRKLHETFVTTKIYIGEENMNGEFFSQFPAAKGYPHFWVVSSDMEILGSQSTGELENGNDGYDDVKFDKFISDWKAKLAN